ncbi:MAG TPA: hypothetical protein VM490_10845, partial [Armatimonadaceae bacterium]|nr:hypothetical protein [Armatimonadaceae bacterium]
GGGRYAGRYDAPPPPEPPPAILAESAAAGGVGLRSAEQMVARSLLTSPYGQKVAPRVRVTLFDDRRVQRLVEAVLPPLSQGVLPENVLKSIRDEDILAFADTLLMDDRAEPLSEQAVADCLKKLLSREDRRKMQDIQARIGTSPEGNDVSDDELLRRWEQAMRAAKRLPETPGPREDSA